MADRGRDQELEVSDNETKAQSQPPVNQTTQRQPKNSKTPAERILEQIVERKLDFSNFDSEQIVGKNFDFSNFAAEQIDLFLSVSKGKYQKRLESQSKKDVVQEPGGILHILAKGIAPDNFDESKWQDYWSEKNLKIFLQWLLRRYPGQLNGAFLSQYITLQNRAQDKGYPLGRALDYGNDAFVRAALSLESSNPELLRSVLEQQHGGQRYVQLAIVRSSILLEDIIKACINTDATGWRGAEGESSPLHILMEKVCDLDELQGGANDDYTDSSVDGDSSVDEDNTKVLSTRFEGSRGVTGIEVYEAWKLRFTTACDVEKTPNAGEKTPSADESGRRLADGSRRPSGISETKRTPQSSAVGNERESAPQKPIVLQSAIGNQATDATTAPADTNGTETGPGVDTSRGASGTAPQQALEAISGQAELPNGVPHSYTIKRMDVNGLLLELIVDFQKSNTSPPGDPSKQAPKDSPEKYFQIASFNFLVKECGNEFLRYRAKSQKQAVNDHVEICEETPYQTRLAALRDAWLKLVDVLERDRFYIATNDKVSEERAIRNLVSDDPVANAVRYYCIRHFEDNGDFLRDCLYHPGHGMYPRSFSILSNVKTERHLDFDLAGLRGTPISQRFLDGLTHLEFESILLYVALPKLLEMEARTRDQIGRVTAQGQTTANRFIIPADLFLDIERKLTIAQDCTKSRYIQFRACLPVFAWKGSQEDHQSQRC
jgi:hypothetical protein